MRAIIWLTLGCFFATAAFSQEVYPLYPRQIPGAKPSVNAETSEINKDGVLIVHKVSVPTLTAYFPLPEKATGKAVIICPGGGYSILATKHEGYDVAERFIQSGIAAFVLKYRIPDDQTMENKEIGPIQDAQRAIQMVRENAKKWGIRKDRIGIMGFSAGGHLASTAATHFKKSYIPRKKKISLRPDFLILVYPVVSFSDSFGHTGSRKNLLGDNPSPEKIAEYSNDLQVTPETPPSLLVHAKNDPVKVENSLAFSEALKKNNVPVELFLYEDGGHGFGMINPSSDIRWMDLVDDWLKKMFP